MENLHTTLFLPKDRVSIRAKFLEFRWVHESGGGPFVLKLSTSEGYIIYYQGESKALFKITLDEFEKECEFEASFEEVKTHKGSISVAKRVSKIKVIRRSILTLDVFTDQNAELVAGSLGDLVLSYLNIHNGSPELFFAHVNRDTLFGEKFSDLMEKISSYRSSLQFVCLDTHISIDKNPTKFHVSSTGEAKFSPDIASLKRHFSSFIEHPLAWSEDENIIYLVWESHGIEVIFRVSANYFDFTIREMTEQKRNEYILQQQRKKEQESQREYLVLNDAMIDNLGRFGRSHLDAALAAGFDINSIYRNGESLLHIFINEDHDLIQALIENGININALNKNKWSPLYLMRRQLEPTEKNKELYVWLVAQGAVAKPDLHSDGWEG